MRSALRRFIGGLRGLFRRGRDERELDEELRDYFESLVGEQVRRGLDRDAAVRAARLQMGTLDAIKEEVRAIGWQAGLETLGRDVRYAARALFAHPGFSAVAIMMLALGIGANTAIFNVVSAVLLEPLPYPDPDRLVTLAGSQSLPDVEDLGGVSRSFEALGATAGWDLDLVGQGDPQRIAGELVSGDVFRALAVRPILGRTLSGADDRRRAPVAVVSHGFWRSHLASDPMAIGRRLQLSGTIYAVIGVMPKDFRMPFFGSRSSVWIPFRVGYPEAVKARGAHFMIAIGRLNETATLRTTQAELDVLARRIGESNPTEARSFTLEPLRERVLGDVRTPLLILLGAVSLVLLIACGNYASLLLARGVARAHEMRVRSALGASRARLVRQLLTESTLLSLIGGAVGLVLSRYGLRALVALRTAALPSFYRMAIDPRTLGFAFLVALATGVLFGLAPAWQLARAPDLRPNGGATPYRSALRRALVVTQLSLALVLLIGAGLLVRSFLRLRSESLGFEAESVLTSRLSLPASRYESIAAQESFLKRLDEGLRDDPATRLSGLVSELPLGGWRMMHNMIVEGQPTVPEGQEPEVYTHEVSPGYFAAIGTPLLLGRGTTEGDTRTSPLVGVVNEAFVRRFAPDRNPLGLRARWARGEPDAWMTVVGVVADARFEALHESQQPTIYTPYSQKQQPWKRWTAVVVRSRSGDPTLLADAVRRRVRSLDAQLPVTDVEAMTAVMRESLSDRRFNLVLLSAFATMAFALAALGVYGLIAHLVAQRSREIGVRMALGAQRHDVLWLMLRQGLTLVACGIVCGGLGALGATRVLRSLLYGISATDPWTFGLAVATLALVGVLASFIPARRAMRVDPCVALRLD